MEKQLAHMLRDLDNRFYRDNGASFSRTRQAPWPGWKRVAAHIAPGEGGRRLLDVACGNLRFERFMEERFGPGAFEYWCCDSCPGLRDSAIPARFVELDVVEALLDGGNDGRMFGASAFDAAVTFGFMHHVPGEDARCALVRSLVEAVRPGGVVALSLWRFASEPHMEARARISTERACADLGISLGPGDYILGWDGDQDARRYCHSFARDEIDRLLSCVRGRARLADRFRADGRTHAMNEYLVFERLT